MRIADLLMLRLQRHPLMIRAMRHAEGLPLFWRRADLERLAASKAMLVIRPEMALGAG